MHDDPQQWAIANFIPFTSAARHDSSSGDRSLFKICVVKLKPHYKIDASSSKWIDYTSGVFSLGNIGDGMSSSENVGEDCDTVYVQKPHHAVPENAVMIGFELTNHYSNTFDDHEHRITKINVIYAPYSELEGKWTKPEPPMVIPGGTYDYPQYITDEDLYHKIDSSGCKIPILGYDEGSSFTANAWLNTRVSEDELLPISGIGFLIKTELAEGDIPGYVEFKFNVAKNSNFVAE